MVTRSNGEIRTTGGADAGAGFSGCVDVCVHNGINVGELVGAERPTEHLFHS